MMFKKHIAMLAFFAIEDARLKWKADLLHRNGSLTADEMREDASEKKKSLAALEDAK